MHYAYIEKFISALEYYADPETWLPSGDERTGDVPAFNDNGKTARAAIAQLRNYQGEIRIKKHGSYVCVKYNGCIDPPQCTKADCCLLAKGWTP